MNASFIHFVIPSRHQQVYHFFSFVSRKKKKKEEEEEEEEEEIINFNNVVTVLYRIIEVRCTEQKERERRMEGGRKEKGGERS